MADIHITRPHRLDRTTAKARLQQVAEDLQRHYGITASWEGDTAHLAGPGIRKGTVGVFESSVSVQITLGLMAKAFRGRIEDRILARCEEVLG